MEGHGLNADLYVDGKKVCFVMDEGNGGCFNYQAHGKNDIETVANRQMINELHDYAKGLPKRLIALGNDKFLPLQPDLDTLIDDAFAELENGKFEKKKIKLMETAIVIGVPNENSYRSMNFKRPLNTVPLAQLQTQVNVCKMSCKKREGEVILNTNLQELGIVI